MYALVFIVLFGGLGTYVAHRIGNMLDVAWGFHDRARATALAAAAPEIERFYMLTGCLPAAPSDLTVPNQGLGTTCPGQNSLTSMPLSGFEHVRENLDPVFNNMNAWQYLASTTQKGLVTDGVWKFNRLALYALDPKKAASDTNYVANYLLTPGNNWQSGTSCNVIPNTTPTPPDRSFNSGSSWCGDMASWWWRLDEKQFFPAMLARQRVWQQRTLAKVAAFYNSFQAWPSFPPNATLAQAAGAPSSLAQAACSQPYTWRITANDPSGGMTKISVPLDCNDLYNQCGKPVSYNFVANATGGGTFYLLSETGIPDPNSSNGSNLYVTSELSL